MKFIIPVLITVDIHSRPNIQNQIPDWIEETLRCFRNFSIKGTFLIPAIVAEQFSSQVRMIKKDGHEIGCHGFAHDEKEEQYNILPFQKQRDFLCEAKKKIESVVADEVVSFRAPAFKINGDTIRALEASGFKADLSVTSQRLGLFSSEVKNIAWLYAPRRPYHPSYANPCKRGDSLIWEIPLSGFIFSFTSNTGIAFGKTAMQLFFRMFSFESLLTKSPIVYMVHPEDIYPRDIKHRYAFHWKHLFPSRTHGFLLRYLLTHNKEGRQIADQIRGLLKTIKDARTVRFFTVKELLQMLQGASARTALPNL